MKRSRAPLPGAFSQLNLSELQAEEAKRSKLIPELGFRLLALLLGLVLAGLFAVALARCSPVPKPGPPGSTPVQH